MLVFKDFFFKTPELLGKMIQVDARVFLKWLETQPSTSCPFRGEMPVSLSLAEVPRWTLKGPLLPQIQQQTRYKKYSYLCFWVLRFLGRRCVIDYLAFLYFHKRNALFVPVVHTYLSHRKAFSQVQTRYSHVPWSLIFRHAQIQT